MDIRKIFEFTSIVFIAITVISFLKSTRDDVSPKYASLLRLSGFTTFVASLHYFLMAISAIFHKDVLSIILYRYADWVITTPVLLLELFVLLKIDQSRWHILLANLVMLLFGLYGEIFYTDSFVKLTSGLLGFIPFIWIVWKMYSLLSTPVSLKDTQSRGWNWSILIAIAFFFIWTLYGVVYFIDSNFIRSILYTFLDLLSKGAFAAIIYGMGDSLIA